MELIELPNVGPVLVQNLRAAGIETPEMLREIGAEGAWLAIRDRVDPSACFHQLQALAGAVAGIPKKDLPPVRKVELKAFFDSHK